jgi:hypothetical protein
VETAYKVIANPRQRKLDAKVYQLLTETQRTRDTKVALEGTTEQDRLRMIAWEVKTRLQPILFLAGETTLSTKMFDFHETKEVTILDETEKELLIEDNIIENSGVAILEKLSLRNLTEEEKSKLKDELLQKLLGKTLSKKELEKSLDSLAADLLSLMVREREIILIKLDSDNFKIVSMDEILREQKEEDYNSQSFVLAPKKGEKTK